LDTDTGVLQVIRGVVGITWNGVPIPMEPKQVQAVYRMIAEGFVYADQVSSNYKAAAVQMSKIREIFSDMGVPYTVFCPHVGKRGHDVRTIYKLVPLGNTAHLGGE
jgi:F420-dependent methylenetetrahydromethanopterin dehydrogenase